ncbi:tetratricopeptide repeat protein [Pseudoalteromonas sp. SCSIO 43101]|uniref:tetratricopeptide repeat protein n=1 Tax=Pseudoalteromonas sp. SCSIO 43101 TaxID=2822847 RepID=UPI00202AC9B2|nr:tetratricopeptide repeat protein [Pseudoalteromonas sp. SCSIO 43101]URQ90739.1 sel1 repeat family protein [Pseudoalteromonas sp. SCSIO 43101]
MACDAAVGENKEHEPYTLKIALTYVEQDNPIGASTSLILLKDSDSQRQVIKKLVQYGYFDTAAEVAINLDKKELVFLVSKYEVKQENSYSTLTRYLANSADISSLDKLKVYIEFFEVLGKYDLIVDTYKAVIEESSYDNEILSYASLELGKLYYYSPHIKTEIDNAQKLFKRAAEYGSDEAKYYLARIYLYERNDNSEALKLVNELHSSGNASGTYLLGRMTTNGWGVTKNEANGVELIKLAVQQGFTPAFAQLGWHYMNGVGVGQDYEAARELLEKAANTNGLETRYAQFNLGWMFYNGMGLTKDYQKAASWFKRSESSGFKDASAMLGKIYEEGGLGVDKNIELALNYYRESDKRWDDVRRLSTLVEKEKIENGKGYVEQGAFFCPDTQSALRAKALDNASDYNPYARTKIGDYCIFNTRGKFYLKQVTAINSDFVYFQDLGRQLVALRRSVKLDES